MTSCVELVGIGLVAVEHRVEPADLEDTTDVVRSPDVRRRCPPR
jgi:hypothetical protein